MVPSPCPWVEDDPTGPLSVYGRTKLAGEQAIAAQGGKYLIFRTSWVFAPHGKNFLLTILRLSRERDRLTIVADQKGAPTSALAIARSTRAGARSRQRPPLRRLSHDLCWRDHLARLRGSYHRRGVKRARRQAARGSSDSRVPIPNPGDASRELRPRQRQAAANLRRGAASLARSPERGRLPAACAAESGIFVMGGSLCR